MTIKGYHLEWLTIKKPKTLNTLPNILKSFHLWFINVHCFGIFRLGCVTFNLNTIVIVSSEMISDSKVKYIIRLLDYY